MNSATNETRFYSITNQTSGADLGTYAADDEDAALDAMARDAGYSDFADSCRAVGREVRFCKRELHVTLV